MSRDPGSIERFHSLDVLRGLAALSVVFAHWHHFFYSGTRRVVVDGTRLPLFDWALVLYVKGGLAVDLFFSLSGFVFYWLYSKHVSEGAISPGRFALLRFSRLYPLHIATLLIVAAGQWWLISTSGKYFIYPNNDSWHFLLNLFLASSWGLERGYSFNGPVWSISVEVVLYALFFACCRLFPVRAIVLSFFSIAGFLVVEKFNSALGRGVGSFFLGGCVYLAYRVLAGSRHAAALATASVVLMTGAWVATAIVALPRVVLNLPGSLQAIANNWVVTVLFPLTILSLALAETRWGPLGRRFSFLGDISYSSYLLHFPLQLLFSAVVARFVVDSSIYYSSWMMLLYFGVLIAASLASYRYFEMPAQKYLRRRAA